MQSGLKLTIGEALKEIHKIHPLLDAEREAIRPILIGLVESSLSTFVESLSRLDKEGESR